MSSPADLEAEVKRLEAELEKKRLEEKLAQLERELAATKASDGADEYEEEIIEEEYIEEEIIEEEYVDEQPVQHHHDAQSVSSQSTQPMGNTATARQPPAAPVAAAPKPKNGLPRWLGGKKKTPAAALQYVTAANNTSAASVTSSVQAPGGNNTAESGPVPTEIGGSASTAVHEAGFEHPTPSSKPPLPAQPFRMRDLSKDPASPDGSESVMELLLGPNLYALGKLVRRSVLAVTRDHDMVLLYFGSKWNRECKDFLPHLLDFYRTAVTVKNKNADDESIPSIEAVYVSHDRSLNDFKELFQRLPFPAMPTGTAALKNHLCRGMKIIDTPSVAVLDRVTGHVITTHAVYDIYSVQRNNEEETVSMLKTWKSIPPIPFDQVVMDVRLKHGKQERSPLYWQE